MDKILQANDSDWQNGFLKMIQLYAVYKRHPSDPKIKLSGGMENIFHANRNQKGKVVAILIIR